jgi:hypothetical protein
MDGSKSGFKDCLQQSKRKNTLFSDHLKTNLVFKWSQDNHKTGLFVQFLNI